MSAVAAADAAPRRIAVLGATGSIGGSALDVIARHPGRLRAYSLSAHRDVAALVELCRRHRPVHAVVADESKIDALSAGLRDAGLATVPAAGAAALDALASDPAVDTVLAAIVGSAGLASTLAAARSGKRLLLANKEAIVMTGALLLEAVAAGGGMLLPVDSEHNAVFQCLPQGFARNPAEHGVERIVLTASGGPFRGRSRASLAGVTPDEACAHPNWIMGRKISVDSATLMNKGLEVIEAHWLFGLPGNAIDVVVHPQSLVHALVGYRDGSMLAELGNPDMRTALAHALEFPRRIAAGVPLLDLIAAGRLDFEPLDGELFRGPGLAYGALDAGGTAATVLNAANEIAVTAFLDERLDFLDIATLIAATLEKVPSAVVASLEDVLEADALARRVATAELRRLGAGGG